MTGEGLSVKLAYTQVSGTTITYYLKSDTTDHMFTKFITQAPLPSVSGNTVGTNFWLDLGMELEQFTINGIVDTVATSSVALIIPGKTDLEEVCRTWWTYTNVGVSSDTLPQLTIDSGQVYAVALKQSDFKRYAAQEDRWEYTLVLLVSGKL